MLYGKIINGIIEQIQPYPETGFIQIPENSIPGMILNQDGTVSNQQPILADKITKRLIDISNRTAELIDKGRFTHNNKRFSTSKGSQLNMNSFLNLDNSGLLTYPRKISLADHMGEYTIISQSELRIMAGLMSTVVDTYIRDGIVLEQQIKACTDVASLDLIVDTRI